MKRILVLLIAFGLWNTAVAQSDGCVTQMPDLVKLINDYSRSSGKKFVLDPRVRARVTLVGINGSDLDYEKLVSILRLHAFTPLEWDGVVYVVPDAVAPDMQKKLGLNQ